MPRLCKVHPGICLTTEGKAQKNLSQDSRRMPVSKEYTEQKTTLKFDYVNDKVKFTLVQAMKAQRGSRGIVLLFL